MLFIYWCYSYIDDTDPSDYQLLQIGGILLFGTNFLKAVFHKFYLVHSWILCPICWYEHFARVINITDRVKTNHSIILLIFLLLSLIIWCYHFTDDTDILTWLIYWYYCYNCYFCFHDTKLSFTIFQILLVLTDLILLTSWYIRSTKIIGFNELLMV